jgi:nucleoside-diphosphate-sugar epimerase
MNPGRRKVLLLGGEGFVGRNIATLFSSEWDCFSVGEQQSPFLERADTFIQANPYQEVIPNTYEAIMHLIDLKFSPPELIQQEQKLIENLGINERNHLIVFSSAVVYANPDSPYGLRKRALEKFYHTFCKEKNIRLTLVRPFNLYGPFQIPCRQGSLVANLIYNHLTATPTEINDMEAKRDFLFVGDLARMVRHLLKERQEGIYDVGSGKFTSIRALVAILEEKVFKEKMQVIQKNSKDLSKDRVAEGDVLERISMLSLEEGLTSTLDFYKKNISLIKDCITSGK